MQRRFCLFRDCRLQLFQFFCGLCQCLFVCIRRDSALRGLYRFCHCKLLRLLLRLGWCVLLYNRLLCLCVLLCNRLLRLGLCCLLRNRRLFCDRCICVHWLRICVSCALHFGRLRTVYILFCISGVGRAGDMYRCTRHLHMCDTVFLCVLAFYLQFFDTFIIARQYQIYLIHRFTNQLHSIGAHLRNPICITRNLVFTVTMCHYYTRPIFLVRLKHITKML